LLIKFIGTNVVENKQLGEILARKANEAKGPVAFLLPKKGISLLDADGGAFCDRLAFPFFFLHAVKQLNSVLVFLHIEKRMKPCLARLKKTFARIFLFMRWRITSMMPNSLSEPQSLCCS